MSRPIQATIFTQNLSHNLAQVKKLTKARPTWAVVKANAYGHGLQAAYAGFAQSEGLALLDLHDAQLLREMGWKGKILLLEGIFTTDDLENCLRLDCDMVVHHASQLILIESWIKLLSPSKHEQVSQKIACWLKLNSGMNRLGFKSAQYVMAYQVLFGLGLTVNHLTHFANADTDHSLPTVSEQWQVFEHSTQFLEGFRSAANSAAILRHANTHADWTRPGIMLYGASPSGLWDDIAGYDLKPAMQLASVIISIQDLEPGQTVGYGGNFTATQMTRIGVIACGYADGYPRSAPLGTPVWVGNNNSDHGCIVPVIGRVSMDMLTVDLSHAAFAEVGCPVELWGAKVPIDQVAKPAGTVGYELMCALAARVPVRVASN